MKRRKIFNPKQAIVPGLLLLSNVCFANQAVHPSTSSINVYPWYLESWVWVTAGLVLGWLVVSALRGDIRERR